MKYKKICLACDYGMLFINNLSSIKAISRSNSEMILKSIKFLDFSVFYWMTTSLVNNAISRMDTTSTTSHTAPTPRAPQSSANNSVALDSVSWDQAFNVIPIWSISPQMFHCGADYILAILVCNSRLLDSLRPEHI